MRFKRIGSTILSIVLICMLASGTGQALAQSKQPLPANETISMAQAVEMIVNSFELQLDPEEMIEQPQVSDFFTQVPDDATYAKSFIIAHLNGLPLKEDVDPEETITKEMFANLLYHALMTKGEFPMILIYIMIEDEAQITPEFITAVQRLLVMEITELDDENKFHPQDAMTAGQARLMLHKALLYIKTHEKITDLLPKVPYQTNESEEDLTSEVTEEHEVEVITEAVTDEVLKVTLDWGMKPNPGYGVGITKIEFHDQVANIYYTLHYPDPNMMYAQVITEAKAVTYISSDYEPRLVLQEKINLENDAAVPVTPVKPSILTE